MQHIQKKFIKLCNINGILIILPLMWNPEYECGHFLVILLSYSKIYQLGYLSNILMIKIYFLSLIRNLHDGLLNYFISKFSLLIKISFFPSSFHPAYSPWLIRCPTPLFAITYLEEATFYMHYEIAEGHISLKFL